MHHPATIITACAGLTAAASAALAAACGWMCLNHTAPAIWSGLVVRATGLSCDVRSFMLIAGLAMISLSVCIFAAIWRAYAGGDPELPPGSCSRPAKTYVSEQPRGEPD